MKRINILAMFALLAFAAAPAFAQSESAYDVGNNSLLGSGAPSDAAAPVGLLDPSRFTVNHAVSFMAGGSQFSNMKSQSIYSTMMQYKFNAPVVLSLNFDMPLHSTFNQYNNLTQDNLQSFDYFRNMPIDAAVSWYPSENFMLRVSVMKMPENGAGSFYNSWYRPSPFHRF